MRKFLVSILTVAVVSVFMVPISSASAPPSQSPTTNLSQFVRQTPSGFVFDVAAAERAGLLRQLSSADIALGTRAKAFTRITEQGWAFDREGALKAGLTSSYVSQVAAMYAAVNSKEAGRHFDWSKLQKSIEARPFSVTRTPAIAPNSTIGSGWAWAGPYVQVSFTEYETRMLIDAVGFSALVTGSGYPALSALLVYLGLAALPAIPVVIAAATLVGIGAAALNWIDDAGSNKGIYLRYYPGPGFFTVWHN